MKKAGLVTVFGDSDDLMAFRGAVLGEAPAWTGGEQRASFHVRGPADQPVRGGELPLFPGIAARRDRHHRALEPGRRHLAISAPPSCTRRSPSMTKGGPIARASSSPFRTSGR